MMLVLMGKRLQFHASVHVGGLWVGTHVVLSVIPVGLHVFAVFTLAFVKRIDGNLSANAVYGCSSLRDRDSYLRENQLIKQ